MADAKFLLDTDVDDTPVDGATTDPVSSNWAYYHEAAATKEIWVSIVNATVAFTQSRWSGYRLNSSGDYARVFFKVPNDFSSITTAAFIFRPLETATEQYDLYAEYGALGANQDEHSESSLNAQTGVTDNQTARLDVSGVLSSLAADDYVGIEINWDSGNGVLMGLEFRYS